MIIAIVEFELAAKNQDMVLQVLTKDTEQALKRQGCLGFKTTRVAGSETGWMLVEEWDTQDAFDAYKASPEFARVGKALMPLMLAPPISRAFEAALA